MSTEIISAGSPLEIKVLDRTFSGRAKNVLVVSDGRPSLDAGRVPAGGDLGNILQGGRSVMGDPTITTTSGGASNTVTLQLNDCGGNAHQGIRRVFAWVSATAGATSVGTSVTGLTTTVSTGVAITAVVGNLSVDALTDVNGRLVITLADAAGTETRFVNFAVDGKIFSSSAVITP